MIQAQRPWSEGRIDELWPYLRRGVLNRIRSAGRHSSVVNRFLERRRGDDRGARDFAEQAVDQSVLMSALGALPLRQRQVIVLRFYERLSVEETAAALSISIGTVKSQTSDALVSLRRRLGVV